MNRNSKLNNVINKYGWDSFEWIVLYECSSKDELDTKEIQYISELDTIKTGYNIQPGGSNGNYGMKRTPEEIALMNTNRKGKAMCGINGYVKGAGIYLIIFHDGHQEMIKNLRGFRISVDVQ